VDQVTISDMRQRSGRRRALAVRGGAPTDEGVTLVEVVLSIALLGIVVVPLLLAVSASIRSSNVSESAAQVETLLVNAVDRVNRAPRNDFQCDVSSPIVAAVETVGWPTSSATIVQEYLDEPTGNWLSGTGNLACPDSTGFYNGIVQRITITITSPDERVSRTLQVVRGDI
jgi:type II secretory pathway pseudopilin PulG